MKVKKSSAFSFDLAKIWLHYKPKGLKYSPLRLFHIFHNGKALRFLVEEGYRNAIFNFMVDFVSLRENEWMYFNRYQNALHFILDSGAIEVDGYGVLDAKGESMTIPPTDDKYQTQIGVRGLSPDGSSFYVVRFFLVF